MVGTGTQIQNRKGELERQEKPGYKDSASRFGNEILSCEGWGASEAFEPESLRFILRVDVASRLTGWEAT